MVQVRSTWDCDKELKELPVFQRESSSSPFRIKRGPSLGRQCNLISHYILLSYILVL